jgi:hypothetical protein
MQPASSWIGASAPISAAWRIEPITVAAYVEQHLYCVLFALVSVLLQVFAPSKLIPLSWNG